MVNVPLLDGQLALRLVGFYADEGGWIDNVLAPSPRETFTNSGFTEDDTNSSTSQGFRAGLRWTPNDDWTIDLSGIYQDFEKDGFGDVDA